MPIPSNQYRYAPAHERRITRTTPSDRHDAVTEAQDHLDKALVVHAKGLHGRVKTSINDAQRCLLRAMGYEPPTAAELANTTTGATGTQTSNGKSPRSIWLAEIARRNKLRAEYLKLKGIT
jgi:hypothetical protein